MRTSLAIITLIILAACADQATRSHAQELSDAGQDDAYCVSLGSHYPDPDYIGCRMKLQNRRLYRQWQNVQLMDRSGQANLPAASSSVPRDRFKPIDPEKFHCWSEPQFGEDYILCSE